MSRQKRKCYSQ